MHRFTDEQVMTTLREVVAENPDYVYESPDRTADIPCLYVHDDKPGCLVGHVLNRLGVELEDLSEYEGSDADKFVRPGFVSERAGRVLQHAQFEQDRGDAWRYALDAAETAYERDV